MKLIQIVLFVATSFISALQAGEMIVKQNEIVHHLPKSFSDMPQEIRCSIYTYLKLKDVVKLSELNKSGKDKLENDIENLIISFSPDKKIACEQLPILKKIFGSFRNLFQYVPVGFMNKTYTEIAKMVKSREGKIDLEKTEIFLTDNLYIFPFYDEVKLIETPNDGFNCPFSFEYPNLQLKFKFRYPEISFISWMRKIAKWPEDNYDYKNLSCISGFISNTLKEKSFLKILQIEISKCEFYPSNLLRKDLEEEKITLEKKAKQKYFSLEMVSVNYPLLEEKFYKSLKKYR